MPFSLFGKKYVPKNGVRGPHNHGQPPPFQGIGGGLAELNKIDLETCSKMRLAVISKWKMIGLDGKCNNVNSVQSDDETETKTTRLSIMKQE